MGWLVWPPEPLRVNVNKFHYLIYSMDTFRFLDRPMGRSSDSQGAGGHALRYRETHDVL